MAKKKKQQQKTKDANPGTAAASSNPASDQQDDVKAPAGAQTATAEPKAPAKGPVDFDAAARDQFANSFKPAWQVAQEKAAASAKPAQEALRSEHALSGEISLDSIPLPPLPTDKPKRQVIAVLVVILLIVIVGIVVSQKSRPAETPAPAESSDR